MRLSLVLAFLFFIGSCFGWVLELLYRNLTHRHKKWINPGFCTGPYLPIYGFGLCTLFLLASLEDLHLIADPIWNRVALFLAMAVAMTLIEYIAGLACLKYLKVRLWDYSNLWGNIQGIICPLFSFFWAALGAAYYFLVHPYILNALAWLSNNLAFSFFIGVFFGVFAVDAAHSLQIVSKLKKYAVENNVIVHYEHIKQQIRRSYEQNAKKYHFFRPFSTERPLSEHLKERRDTFEQRPTKRK